MLATPTWFGQPSSVVKRVLERMDAMLSETDDDGLPVAFNRVAGFVVTGNEDGAHHVIAELAQAVNDIGYTVPAQAWTYWNKGPGPGPDLPRDRRGPRVVGQDRAHRRRQPRRPSPRRSPRIRCRSPRADERRMSVTSAAAAVAADDPRAPVDGILGAIGNTPLVALRRYLLRPDVDVWAKLEASNPGGSAKDRPAARMIQDALDERPHRPRHDGRRVDARATPGIGLAQACRYHGLRLICVVDARAHERSVRAMRALGADVRVVTRARSRDRRPARRAAARSCGGCSRRSPNSFWPDQYANESNPAAHAAGTMREIDEALEGQTRLPVRRHEHDRARCAAAATTCASTAAAPARRGRLDGQRALRRRARNAPAARLRRRRRDRALGRGRASTSSSASPTSTASSAAGASPSARRSSPGRPRAASRSRSRRSPAQMEPGSRCAAIFPDGGDRLPRDGLRRRLGRARARLRARRGSRLSSARGSASSELRGGVPMRIAIAGLGPKGLFALERLLDHALRRCPPRHALAVDLFEPHPAPGRRPGLRPGQPGYLRMNFAADAARHVVAGEPRRAARRAAAVRRLASGVRAATRTPIRRARRSGRYLERRLRDAAARMPAERRPALAPRDGARRCARARDGWELRGRRVAPALRRGARRHRARALVADGLAPAGRMPRRSCRRSSPSSACSRRDAVAPGATVASAASRSRSSMPRWRSPRAAADRSSRSTTPTACATSPARDDAGAIMPFTRSGPAHAREARACARRGRCPALAAHRGGRPRADRSTRTRPSTLERDLLPILADVRAREPAAAAGGDAARSERLDTGRAPIERSLAIGAGLVAARSILGARPRLARALPGDRRAPRRRRARARATGPRSCAWRPSMERVAFGPPPVNAAKLLALVDAGRVDLAHLLRRRASSRAAGATLLRSGARRAADRRRGRRRAARRRAPPATAACSPISSPTGTRASRPGSAGSMSRPTRRCRGLGGSLTPGLAAIGRPTEDSVIGNDTLSRSLHPQADRWARRVVERCRDLAARAGARERAPA